MYTQKKTKIKRDRHPKGTEREKERGAETKRKRDRVMTRERQRNIEINTHMAKERIKEKDRGRHREKERITKRKRERKRDNETAVKTDTEIETEEKEIEVGRQSCSERSKERCFITSWHIEFGPQVLSHCPLSPGLHQNSYTDPVSYVRNLSTLWDVVPCPRQWAVSSCFLKSWEKGIIVSSILGSPYSQGKWREGTLGGGRKEKEKEPWGEARGIPYP